MLREFVVIGVLSFPVNGLAGVPNYLRSHATWHHRIINALCCHDCDGIPKVANAGKSIYEAPYLYQIMHNGLRVIKDDFNGAWQACIIERLRGHYCPQEEYVFYEALKTAPANSVMVELGGPWGYYSMWFQKVVPGAQNFLLEASSDLLNRVVKPNFKLNEMKAEFRDVFVANKDELCPSPSAFLERLGFRVDTPIMTIDELIAKEHIPFVWMLRSNIGGMECQMLAGCKEALAEHKIGCFFISTHSESLHSKCCEILRSAGFIIFAEFLPTYLSTSDVACDGLIAARAPHVAGPSDLYVSKRIATFY